MAGPLNGHSLGGKAHEVRSTVSQAIYSADRGVSSYQTQTMSGGALDVLAAQHVNGIEFHHEFDSNTFQKSTQDSAPLTSTSESDEEEWGDGIVVQIYFLDLPEVSFGASNLANVLDLQPKHIARHLKPGF